MSVLDSGKASYRIVGMPDRQRASRRRERLRLTGCLRKESMAGHRSRRGMVFARRHHARAKSLYQLIGNVPGIATGRSSTAARSPIASSECPTASVQAADVSASGLQAAAGKIRWLVIDPDNAWCLRDGITLAPRADRQRTRRRDPNHRAEIDSGKVTDRV